VVDFLEAKLLAEDALVEVAARGVAAVVLAVEGLPDLLPAPAGDPHDRPAARVRAASWSLSTVM